jgi:hypothetical protein
MADSGLPAGEETSAGPVRWIGKSIQLCCSFAKETEALKRMVTSSPVQNSLIVPAMLARHGDAIGTLVAALAVPLPPIAALAAYLTVSGAAILYYAVPAEGIPVASTAFRTKVHAQKLFQRYTLVPTG